MEIYLCLTAGCILEERIKSKFIICQISWQPLTFNFATMNQILVNHHLTFIKYNI